MKKLINTMIITSLVIMMAGCGGDGASDSEMGIESYNSGLDINSSADYDYDSYNESEYSYETEDYTDTYGNSDYTSDDTDTSDDKSITNDKENTVELSSDKLIYSSDIRLETTAFEDSTDQLKELIDKYDVIIENENYNNSNYGWYREDYTITATRTASYDLRVPSNNYSEFIECLDELGNITYRTSDVQNMSSTYRDNEARLETLKAKRDRLVELMEQTGTITEIIQVEDSLEQVDYQIEQLKLSQQNIDLGVAYSYVSISMEEVGEYTKIQEQQITFLEELKNAFKDSWDALVHILRSAIILLAQLSIVFIVPFIIFVIILVIVIRLIIKKSNNKRRKATLNYEINISKDSNTNHKDNSSGDNKNEQSK